MPKLKNPKHELLARNVVKNNFNLTKAYLETYPAASYESANARVSPLVKDSQIKSRIEEIAMAKGMTPEYLIGVLHDETQALKSIYYEGNHVADVPDHGARIESVKTGLKLYGFIGGDGNTTNIDARSINNYNIEKDDIAQLNSTLNELKKLKRPDSLKSE